MWSRARERLRRIAGELRAAGQETATELRGLTRACTCGNPRRVGRCPRHGTLG